MITLASGRQVSGVLLTSLLAGLGCFADLYVSPSGDDRNPGSQEKPFQTIVGARDAVRRIRQEGGLPEGGLTVWLAAGTYTLRSSLEFGEDDGGTATGPVTYRAMPGADVWISGGQTVPDALFKPVTEPAILERLPAEARGRVFRLSLADAGVTDYVREVPEKFSGFTRVEPDFIQVFCNGQQMQWARWPNEGFAKFAEIVDVGSGLRDYTAYQKKQFRPGVFRYTGERPERWDVERGVWMMGFWARAYLCTAVQAGKIDTEKKEITWKTDLRFGLDTWGANRWYAFNLLEELDMPGEWYIDRDAGNLYFWPPEDLGRCQVLLTQLRDPMLRLTGAQYVIFRNIGFEGGRGDAIVVNGGREVQFIGCEIRNVGRHAVQLLKGSGHRIVGCDIHHVGYSGIIMNGGNRRTLEAAGFEAVNNHIHHTNTVKRTHASPVNMNGVGMRLAHNLIHHAPHSAVFYGGNDLIMEFNDIYWCHYETAEGGVFYTGYNWTYRGNEIRNNYIHHINDSLDGSPTGVNVVHLDDCAAGTAFRGNVVYRVGRGVSMCGGPWNVADNNLFIDCQVGVALSARGLAWWTWTRHEDGSVTARDTRASHAYSTNNGLLNRLREVPWNEEPYISRYPNMGNLLKVDPIGAPWWCEITRNIAINGLLMQVGKDIKPEWVTIENNWGSLDNGDPGIEDPYGEKYRLVPGAPAAKTGFEPIPFAQIGLVNDGTRRSWPVAAESPPADFRPAWLLRREMEKRMPGGLPVVGVRRASAVITIDGVIDPEEWTPGEKQTVSVNTYTPETLRYRAIGGPAAFPSTAWLQVDDANLYIGFLNDVDPKGGIVGGHTWGKSDAVEIALSVIGDDNEVGPIMIWRGYTDGTNETSGEAGAPAAVVTRTAQGVRYACRTLSETRWSAEFAIPFAAVGIDPVARNPRILFSLAVRKVSGDQWVTWKSAPGASWDVRKSGILWLEPFGDITLNGSVPSQANIHVFGTIGDTSVLMKAEKNCEVAQWHRPVGSRITAGSSDLPADRWVPFSFAFTPENDGEVDLMLMGRGHRRASDNQLVPVWTYYDEIEVTGAQLVNGGFEENGNRGQPAGWRTSGQPLWIRDSDVPARGKACVKTWHDGRYIQRIKVTKDRTVGVNCLVRGEMVRDLSAGH